MKVVPKTDKIDTKSLTDGERLTIWRRRENLSQTDAAKRLKVTPAVYGRMERDLEKATHKPSLGALQLHERCFIIRRRNDYAQLQVAKAIGVCRWMVVQMERGTADPSALANWWGLTKKAA